MNRQAMGKWMVVFGISLLAGGCTFYARSPEQYRDDTTKLLAAKGAELDTCYDNVLKTTPTAAGKVTVVFTVEEKSGKIADAKADPTRTSAPQPLIDCVTTAINGLVLTPPDQRKGIASFEYAFARTSVPGTPAAPGAAPPAS